MKKKASYYVNIPFRVLDDNDLTASEKVMYGYISSLTNQKGYCFASNKYLSSVSGDVSERTVQRWIAKLQDRDYIRVHFVRDASGIVVERRIYLYDNPLERAQKNGDLSDGGTQMSGGVTQMSGGGRHECQGGGDTNVGYNTKANTKSNTKEEGEPPPDTNDQSMETPYRDIELYAIKAFEKVYGRVPSPREEIAFRSFIERNGEPSEKNIDDAVTICNGRFMWMVDKLPRLMRDAKEKAPKNENDAEWVRLWNENKDRV